MDVWRKDAAAAGRARLWLCVALFAVAVVPRLYHVRSRFMDFADHNAAYHSIYARNLKDHGWLPARLGMITNAWPAEPGDLGYFAHHAPTVALMTSVMFMLLGVSEPVARILPILASAATCPLMFLLGRRLFADVWALLAALLFAAAPGAIYYGQALNPESFVVFLGLSSLYAWCRYAEGGGRGWWCACLALIAAAILTDWPGAYLAPAVAAASILSPATRGRALRMSAQAAATAAACLLLVFAQILWVKGSYQDLRAALSFRVLSSSDMAFTWNEYFDRIRYNAGIAVTPPLCWLALAGAAVCIAAIIAGGLRRRSGTASPAAIPAGPISVGAALIVFGSLHHVVFTNATHFNQNISYFLIPPFLFLAAAVPAAASALLRRWIPRGAAAAALVLALPSLVGFAREAPLQVSVYFNTYVAPGWPLLGQALHHVVPEQEEVFSTGTLSYPQFKHYLWRRIEADRRDPAQLVAGAGPAVLLRDLNARLPESTDALLSQRARQPVLNFDLYALAGGAPAPRLPALEPPPVSLTLVEERFGEALTLFLHGFGPTVVEVERPRLAQIFFGVPWSPGDVPGRIVHATFVWQRLDAEARSLVPGYELVHWEGGVPKRVPPMWPLEPKDADLAGLAPGETARHELIYFFGEWLPAGPYVFSITVQSGGQLLPVTTVGREPGRAPQVSLGGVTFKFRGEPRAR